MAQSRLRDNPMLDSFPVTPGNDTTPVPHWLPPRGMAPSLLVDQLSPEYASDLLNWLPVDGRFESRPAIATVGTAASINLLSAIEFTDASGTTYIVRWTLDDMQVWDGASWSAVTGVALTGTTTDLICYTIFGGYLIFSNGVSADGMWEVDVGAGTGSQIAGAPACKHLTTAGSRVIASAPVGFPNRIQWSVKNDHTDWAGLGSGEEDLLSTPGGIVDQQFGVYPVTDTVSLVVRSGSVWTMTEGGDFDAPFTFSRQYPGVGGTSRFGVVAVPGGIVLLGRDGVKEIQLGQAVQHIGLPVDSVILSEVSDFDQCYMMHLARRDEILLKIGIDANYTKIYRYNRLTSTWTKTQYSFPSNSVSVGRFTSSLTYDDLIGTYDDIVGTYDMWGVTAGRAGLLFAMQEGTRYVVSEGFDADDVFDFDDNVQEVNTLIRAQTGLIVSPNNLYCVGVVAVQYTYVAPDSLTVSVEYSTDDGTTWQTYMTEVLAAASTPKTYAMRYYVESERLMLRISANARMTLYGLVVYTKQGRQIGL